MQEDGPPFPLALLPSLLGYVSGKVNRDGFYISLQRHRNWGFRFLSSLGRCLSAIRVSLQGLGFDFWLAFPLDRLSQKPDKESGPFQ